MQSGWAVVFVYGDYLMLTNILLGLIIFLLIIIFGALCNIDRKLLSNAEYLRLKRLSDGLMVSEPTIRKVKDEKKAKVENQDN